MPCTAPIITMLEPFRCLFTAPTWKKMLTLLTGNAARTRPPHGDQRPCGRPAMSRTRISAPFTRCSTEPAGRRCRRVGTCSGSSSRPLSKRAARWISCIDETLERRWGSKIRKRGHYRDSALSSHERSVSSPGLRWIVLAVVVRVPWTRQRWALPFLCVLATTPRSARSLGIRHKTLGMRARQVVSLLRRWLPGVPIKLLGDGAYSILELGLHCARQQITLIAPFRLDSVIHQPAPVRDPTPIGRPRVVGPRLPSLEHVLHDPHTVWQRLTLDWYGEGRTDAGAVYWHRLVVSLWLDAVADSLGAHARPSGKTTAQSPVFHRPDAACRRDRARLHEALEFGNHLRGKPCPFRHRDPTAVVGSGH